MVSRCLVFFSLFLVKVDSPRIGSKKKVKLSFSPSGPSLPSSASVKNAPGHLEIRKEEEGPPFSKAQSDCSPLLGAGRGAAG